MEKIMKAIIDWKVWIIGMEEEHVIGWEERG